MMKLKRVAAGIFVSGVLISGVINQASAECSTLSCVADGLAGKTCPSFKTTIPVTQTAEVSGSNLIIWRMDSSTLSRDRCYAKVDSLYKNKYSSEWNEATETCTKASEQQKEKVATYNTNERESYPNCDNTSDYIQEETGDRY